MNSFMRLKPIRSHHSLLTVLHWRRACPVLALVLCCFSLFSSLEAVSPAPDGGYASGNTAEGSNALFSLTTGAKNTADGYLALYFNASGYDNTAIGSQSLYSNTTGYENTAVGFDALYYNTSGLFNTATGYLALFNKKSSRPGGRVVGASGVVVERLNAGGRVVVAGGNSFVF